MKTILLATHNKGKIKRYQKLFEELNDLKFITLAELGIEFKVDEPFPTSEENSIHKAQEYAKLSGLPTIAIDEAVMTNFLPANEQPGVFVRRFKNGEELSDLGLLNAWREILALYPNDKHEFTWDFRLSYYNPTNNELRTAKAIQIDSVAIPFSEIMDPGYPLSSFLIPSSFNRPYSELSPEEFLAADRISLKPFIEFMKTIN